MILTECDVQKTADVSAARVRVQVLLESTCGSRSCLQVSSFSEPSTESVLKTLKVDLLQPWLFFCSWRVCSKRPCIPACASSSASRSSRVAGTATALPRGTAAAARVRACWRSSVLCFAAAWPFLRFGSQPAAGCFGTLPRLMRAASWRMPARCDSAAGLAKFLLTGPGCISCPATWLRSRVRGEPWLSSTAPLSLPGTLPPLGPPTRGRAASTSLQSPMTLCWRCSSFKKLRTRRR